MTTSDYLNKAVSVLNEDDGSLPEVRIEIALGSANDLYGYLKSRSSGFAHRNATYWSMELSQDVEIQWSTAASELIQLADSSSFHIVLGGMQSESGNAIPDLGIYFDATSLTLDYRMGPVWTESAVLGFFELVSSLLHISGAVTFSHSVNRFDHDGSVLIGAWESWRDTHVGRVSAA